MILLNLLVGIFLAHIIDGALDSSQYMALHMLFTSTNGNNWIFQPNYTAWGVPWNFSSSPHEDPCNDLWQGIYCNGLTPNQIVHLNISNFNVSGQVSNGIFLNLTSLITLDMSNNFIFGALPEDVIYLSNLNGAFFDNNKFTGNIPNFGATEMPYLYGLFFSNNMFTGHIPIAFGNLTSLQSLYLDENSLTGDLPPTLWNMHNLTYLYLKNNHLEGRIDNTGLSKLSGLVGLTFGKNMFTGPCPFLLPFPHLRLYSVRSNYFTGTLPSSIGNLEALENLRVDYNFFTGTLPSSMYLLSNMTLFFAFDNFLVGNPGNAFSPSTQLVYNSIDLSVNSFTGTIPQQLMHLSSLQVLDLTQNCFHGFISSDICSLSNLQVMALSGLTSGLNCRNYVTKFSNTYFTVNEVQGTVPSCVWSMKSLLSLQLAGNGLHGTIPNNIQFDSSGLSLLKNLTLSHNHLTGIIPQSLQEWHFQTLDLSTNKIGGTLDNLRHNIYIGQDNSSMSLTLEVNRLSDDIPVNIRNAPNINILNGNLFQCSKRTVPLSDPSAFSYVCGSDEFNQSIVVCMVLSGTAGFLTLFYWFYTVHPTKNSAPVSPSQIPIFGTGKNNINERLSFRSRSTSFVIDTLNMFTTDNIDLLIGRVVLYFLNEDIWHESIPQMIHVYRYFRLLQVLRQVIIQMTIFIVLICMPMYLAFAFVPVLRNFSTHEQEYTWAFTSAFYSGTVPAVVFALLWSTLAIFTVSRVISIKKVIKSEELFDEARDKRLQVNESLGSTTGQSNASSLVGRDSTFVLFLCFCLVIVNITVIGAVNAGYLYVQFSSHVTQTRKIISQFFVASIKLVWNMVVLRKSCEIIASFSDDKKDKKIHLYISMMIFNNIVLPCIVTGCSDSSCFNEFFVNNNDPVNVDYLYTICSDYPRVLPNGKYADSCSLVVQNYVSFQYFPPFLYSYQCGSSIVINYTPLFIYTYALLMLVEPFVNSFFSNISVESIPSWLLPILPGILWPEEPIDKFQRLLNPDVIVMLQLQHILVMLTFGVTNAFLAVAICGSALMSTVTSQVFIVRYLKRRIKHDLKKMSAVMLTREDSDRDYVSESGSFSSYASATNTRARAFLTEGEININDACSGSSRKVLNGLWIAVIGASVFYTVILFDVAADKASWQRAMWVPCVFLPLPFAMYRTANANSSFVFRISRFLGWKVPVDNSGKYKSGVYALPGDKPAMSNNRATVQLGGPASEDIELSAFEDHSAVRMPTEQINPMFN